jgi:hypothetical protein
MKPRLVAVALAALFTLVGSFLLTSADFDPAPRDEWRTWTGSFTGAEFVDTQKLGRRAVVTIDGTAAERSFALDHVERLPQVEAALRALPALTTIDVQCVDRTHAGDWARPGEPLPLLVLRRGGEVLYDRDRDRPAPGWITAATRIAGGAAIAVGLLLLALSLRPVRRN